MTEQNMIEQNNENVLLTAIELTSDQVNSINNHKLDLEFIKTLQNVSRYPRKVIINYMDPMSLGRNFDNAIYVGTRLYTDDGSYHDVFMKKDGWFMTPYDGTNCNPVKDNNGNPKVGENGYEFLDMSQLAAVDAARGTANIGRVITKFGEDRAGEAEKLGGKTRKYRKRKLHKSKRRYRK